MHQWLLDRHRQKLRQTRTPRGRHFAHEASRHFDPFTAIRGDLPVAFRQFGDAQFAQVAAHGRLSDRMTFALGCGIAGIAGAAFTTIGSTGPTAGSLYIVDTFLTVVFGGAASLFGTIASAFTIAQTQSTLEFFLNGSMAKVLTLSAVVIFLMIRPQGLFAVKVRR